ncbi:hypothetical protein BH11PSE13_BH11PSE13_13360 [soil metagenome]
MVWQHLAIPLFSVFFVINRLVVWSAQTVKWPDEVEAALGAPMTQVNPEADRSQKLRAVAENAPLATPR